MRLKAVLACAGVAAVAVPASVAIAGDGDKVTGGGQVLVGARGAGDTIAFTAQQTGDAVKGQVQYVDRTGGTGQGQTTYHGRVTCVDAVANVAQIAGVWRNGGDFHIYIEDNGEGAGADSDIVTMTPNAVDPSCDEEPPDEEDQIALARGNAQVRDGEQARGGSSSLSFKLARLAR